MMKKEWVRPLTIVDQFVPNEYVAACGDSGVTYKFTCDAGGGAYGEVYLETNGKEGLQTGKGGDSHLSSYHACGTTHEAESTDDFLPGYYIPWFNDEVKPVIVWRGPKGDNTHCTENLDMSTWETGKS